ncbi:MAG: bifunctional biotin--[acetyl-CoA-carboxylase] ligase/biotin operon repressor BirA [Halioglobus sp.]|nr:bifunctional biotin--[acetyl-CoA-carboxylase] ligase/biotin operon repressor BirA [Halioglobus sp.]
MSRSTLLSVLANGDFHSGQALADLLGVSRTAVWKQLNLLAAEFELEVESRRGKGYRIPGGIDLLDPAQVKGALNSAAQRLLGRLEILETIDSTNAQVMRRAEQGAAAGLVCSAEQQTAGRGRQGRRWVSPYASNLYLSVLWDFSQGAAALEGLSLAVGVAVARALQNCGLIDIQLKWPNDVLHRNAKLGGILLEMQGDVAGPCRVVVGIGLNVAMPAAAGDSIDQAWTDIATLSEGEPPCRSALLAAVLNELLPLLAAFEQRGFRPWRTQWQALDALADAAVSLAGPTSLVGIARGVDERGALLLDTGTGIQVVHGGEISLRRVP